MTYDFKKHAECLAYAVGSPHPIARIDCALDRVELIAEGERLQARVLELEAVARKGFECFKALDTQNARLDEDNKEMCHERGNLISENILLKHDVAQLRAALKQALVELNRHGHAMGPGICVKCDEAMATLSGVSTKPETMDTTEKHVEPFTNVKVDEYAIPALRDEK